MSGSALAGEDSLTSQERAALVTWHLAHGESLTVYNVMDLTGLTRQGADMLLARLSRVLPIYEDDGVWEVAAMREL